MLRMNKIKAMILIVMSNLIYSPSVYAFSCEFIPNKVIKVDNDFFQFDQSLCHAPNEFSILPFLYRKNNLLDRVQQFNDWKQDQSYNTNQFWSKWNDDFADHPIFTEYNDSMYYGLGFWLPRKYNNEEVDDIDDAEQWVLNHGVQMSLGFGSPNNDGPQVRLDYRWHTKNSVDDGISLQVHVPIN